MLHNCSPICDLSFNSGNVSLLCKINNFLCSQMYHFYLTAFDLWHFQKYLPSTDDTSIQAYYLLIGNILYFNRYHTHIV